MAVCKNARSLKIGGVSFLPSLPRVHSHDIMCFPRLGCVSYNCRQLEPEGGTSIGLVILANIGINDGSTRSFITDLIRLSVR